MERYRRHHTLNGQLRKFPAHRERANATLSGSGYELFFLLNYFKINLLQ